MALYAFDAVVLCFSLRFFLLFLFVLKNNMTLKGQTGRQAAPVDMFPNDNAYVLSCSLFSCGV